MPKTALISRDGSRSGSRIGRSLGSSVPYQAWPSEIPASPPESRLMMPSTLATLTPAAVASRPFSDTPPARFTGRKVNKLLTSENGFRVTGKSENRS